MVQMNEMTAEDVVKLAKSAFPDDNQAQIELIKSVYHEASYGKTVKDAIKDSNGAGSRSATQARTMAQPTAPGADVGQIDDPDEIQRRFRDEDVPSEWYNKGNEVDEDAKKSAKPSKKAQMPPQKDEDDDNDDDDDGQDDEDGEFLPDDQMQDDDGDGEPDEEDPRKKSTKKSSATKKSHSATQEDYENETYRSLLKGQNSEDIIEAVDAAPVVQKLVDITAEGNAKINVKMDNIAKSMATLTSLVKSQAKTIQSQDAKIEALRSKLATNHNKVIDFVEKSFADYGEPLAKSQTSAPVQQTETIVRSATPRPTINGAIATIGSDSVSTAPSGKLTGDYRRDKKFLAKSLQAAAERGENEAMLLLSEVDVVPASYPQGFEAIVQKIPSEWLG